MRRWITFLMLLAMAAAPPMGAPAFAQDPNWNRGDVKKDSPEALMRLVEKDQADADKHAAEATKARCFKSRYHLMLVIDRLEGDLTALEGDISLMDQTTPPMTPAQKAGMKRGLDKRRDAVTAALKQLQETKACTEEPGDPTTAPFPKEEDISNYPDTDKGKQDADEDITLGLARAAELKCIGGPPEGVPLSRVRASKGFLLTLLRGLNGSNSKRDWVVAWRRKLMVEIDRLDGLGPCPEKHAAAPTGLNKAVFDELNKARANPAEYARTLKGPGAEEAVAFLKAQAPAPEAAYDEKLAAAAQAHLADLARTGEVSHTGSDGSSVMVRVNREGFYSMTVAEELSTGEDNGAAVIRQLIIDANTPGRGHRLDLFNPRLVLVGIACGTHPKFGHICVIDFSIKPMDR